MRFSTALTGKPFSLSSAPAFFYGSQSHAKAFEDLQSAIRRRESLSVLSGDIGTGKTTLCRAVLGSSIRKRSARLSRIIDSRHREAAVPGMKSASPSPEGTAGAGGASCSRFYRPVVRRGRSWRDYRE
jgi:hypothetical protein